MARRAAHITLAALLATAAALFIVGVTIERAQGEPHAHEQGHATVDSHHAGSGEEGQEAETTEPTAHTDDEPRILGINAESTPLLVLATVASLLLAAAVLRRPRTRLLVLVAIAMIAFAVLDIREVAHQLADDRTAIAILAATIATLHLVAAALAAHLARHHGLNASAPSVNA